MTNLIPLIERRTVADGALDAMPVFSLMQRAYQRWVTKPYSSFSFHERRCVFDDGTDVRLVLSAYTSLYEDILDRRCPPRDRWFTIECHVKTDDYQPPSKCCYRLQAIRPTREELLRTACCSKGDIDGMTTPPPAYVFASSDRFLLGPTSLPAFLEALDLRADGDSLALASLEHLCGLPMILEGPLGDGRGAR